jgi:hypothetical protein
MGFRYRQGGVTVTLDDGLERFARAAVEAAAPGALKALRENVKPVFDAAYAAWPVKTGISRDGLDMTETVDADRSTISVGIRNDVPYAIFVRPKAWYQATTAWQRLVRGPMLKVEKRIVTDLVRRIGEEMAARG